MTITSQTRDIYNDGGNGTAATHSSWHSPVPYLFGGLAAMLGLIAFALLILACSYWRLSGYLDSSEDQNRERDLEAGKEDKIDKPVVKVMEEKFLVIMAGEVKPTYLATPMMTSRSASSFVVDSFNKTCRCSNEKNIDHVINGQDELSEEAVAEPRLESQTRRRQRGSGDPCANGDLAGEDGEVEAEEDESSECIQGSVKKRANSISHSFSVTVRRVVAWSGCVS
ncbi:hypothetical protein ACFE04_008103 [Oxalis oulophora]